MDVAIVSTQRAWNKECECWAQYHLSRGFKKIYVYIDDGHTDHIPQTSGVEFIACTKAYWDSLTPDSIGGFFGWMETLQIGFGTAAHRTPENVMIRQMINTCLALKRAADDGIDWLLHIDDDEYFWCPDSSVNEHFSGIHAGIGMMYYLNHEAILLCEGDFSNNGQRTSFRKNFECLTEEQKTAWSTIIPGKPYFASYCGGKSAARVRPNTTPDGCHLFHIDPALEKAGSSMPCILHRPYRSISHFCDKHLSNGIWATDWCFGRPWIPPEIYVSAQQLVKDNDLDQLRSLYSRSVALTNAERDKIEAAGYLLTIEAPWPSVMTCGETTIEAATEFVGSIKLTEPIYSHCRGPQERDSAKAFCAIGAGA